MTEQWGSVDGIPGYQISDHGHIRAMKFDRLLSPSTNASGYKVVSLRIAGAGRKYSVHRLVAEAFIPRVEGKEHVNHIDGVRTNNHRENLEWVTPKENAERRVNERTTRRGRPVVQLTLSRKYLRTWESATAIQRALGHDIRDIGACCRGRRQTVGGSRWMYADAYEPALPGEQWKEVETKGRKWMVSSFGRIRTQKTGLITYGSEVGGRMVASDDGTHVFMHRLVAIAFCIRSEGKDVVNHIDGNPRNNASVNLEWVTQKENVRHAVATGLKKSRTVPVRRHNEDGSWTDFVSLGDARDAARISSTLQISRVCRGMQRTAGGCKWSYIDSGAEMDQYIESLEKDTVAIMPMKIDVIDPAMERFISELLEEI